MEIVLNVRGLNVYYDSYGTKHMALDNISFDLYRGEVLGIVGESGAGKSTVGKAIMRLVDPPNISEGEIIYGNRNILTMSDFRVNSFRWRKISMIFQASMNSLDPVSLIEHNFISVMRDKIGIRDRKAMLSKTDKLLEEVGLDPSVRKRFPHELSGGMKQRVMVALALSADPEIVIADEPTTALDVVTEYRVLALLRKIIRKEGKSMIYISHDLPSVIFMADRLLIMEKGKIVEEGNVKDLINNPKNSYTKLLISETFKGKEVVYD